MSETPNDSVAVLIPVFNDWAAVQDLLPQLDAVLAKERYRVTLVIVDDGSSEPVDLAGSISGLTAIQRVTLVSLRRNLGHQRGAAVYGAAVSRRARLARHPALAELCRRTRVQRDHRAVDANAQRGVPLPARLHDDRRSAPGYRRVHRPVQPGVVTRTPRPSYADRGAAEAHVTGGLI